MDGERCTCSDLWAQRQDGSHRLWAVEVPEAVPHDCPCISYWTVLRDPVDRIISRVFKRHVPLSLVRTSLHHTYVLGEDDNLDEFKEFSGTPAVDNWHVRCLNGPDVYALGLGALNRTHLAIAKERLARMNVVPMANVSSPATARRLGLAGPIGEKTSLGHAEVPEHLPEDMMATLHAHNTLDAELYEYAKSLYETQMTAFMHDAAAANAHALAAAPLISSTPDGGWRGDSDRSMNSTKSLEHSLASLVGVPAPVASLDPRDCERERTYKRAAVLFVHIPKNAGTLIESTLLGLKECDSTSAKSDPLHYNCGSVHATASQFTQCNASLFRSMPSFAVLREPIDRCRSLFGYLLDGAGKSLDRERTSWARDLAATHGMRGGFEAFVGSLAAGTSPLGRLGQQQSAFVLANASDATSELLVGTLLCTETLDSDWLRYNQSLRATEGLELPALPTAKARTSTERPELEEPTAATLEIFATHPFYRVDVQLWQHYCDRVAAPP